MVFPRKCIGMLACLMLFSMPSHASETEWLVAPYVWLPDVALDQSVDDGGTSGNISGSDLLDKSDAAGMIRVEASRANWGFTLDYIFLALSDETVVGLPPPGSLSANVRAELDLTVLELGGFYRPSADDNGVDYLFGLRSISADKTLLVTPGAGVTQRFDGDSGITDVFVGARYLHRFNDNWDATLRGDLSFGESEGTVNLLASVGYRFPGPFAIQLGYRHVTLEYEDTVDGVGETTEIELSGPYLGAVFRF